MTIPFNISESKYVKNLVFNYAYKSLPTNRERLAKYDMYRDLVSLPNNYCVSVVWHVRSNNYEIALISLLTSEMLTMQINHDWYVDQVITNLSLEQVEDIICSVAALPERVLQQDADAGFYCMTHDQRTDYGSDYRDRTRYCIGCNPEKFETEDTTHEI